MSFGCCTDAFLVVFLQVVWLSERLSVLDTVVHQKLGLFHHLPADVSVSFVTSSQKRALLGQPPISGSAAGTPLSAVASSTNLLSATTSSSASSPMAASSGATAPAGLLTHNASFPLPTLAASSAQRTRFSLENPSLDMVIQAVFLPRVSRTAAAAQGTASGSTAPVMSAPPNAASGGSGSGQCVICGNLVGYLAHFVAFLLVFVTFAGIFVVLLHFLWLLVALN